MVLKVLQGRHYKSKLRWWYKIVTMLLFIYLKEFFLEVWNIKPSAGQQREVQKRLVDDIVDSLELRKGESSSKEILASVDEC